MQELPKVRDVGTPRIYTLVLNKIRESSRKEINSAMHLDSDKFESNVRDFLASPEAEEFWEEAENSVLFNVVASLIMLPIGLILVCTIILAKIGILMIWGILKSFLTLEVFQDQRKKLKSQPEKLVPLINAGIIIGPRGHGLVLGSFSRTAQEDMSLLGQISQTFGDFYTEGSDADSDEPVVSLLRDDVYVPGRRRTVPRSHSAGRDLVLFDMEIKVENAEMIDDVVWVACVATREKPLEEGEPPRGSIIQIPWWVVGDAVE